MATKTILLILTLFVFAVLSSPPNPQWTLRKNRDPSNAAGSESLTSDTEEEMQDQIGCFLSCVGAAQEEFLDPACAGFADCYRGLVAACLAELCNAPLDGETFKVLVPNADSLLKRQVPSDVAEPTLESDVASVPAVTSALGPKGNTTTTATLASTTFESTHTTPIPSRSPIPDQDTSGPIPQFPGMSAPLDNAASPKDIIIGGVLGGVLFFVLMGALGYWVRRHYMFRTSFFKGRARDARCSNYEDIDLTYVAKEAQGKDVARPGREVMSW